MKSNDITCNCCGSKIGKSSYKSRKTEGLEFRYIECKKCYTIYPSSVLDETAIDNISEIARLREEAAEVEDKDQLGSIQEKIKELIRTNIELEKELKEKHGSTFEQFGRIWRNEA